MPPTPPPADPAPPDGDAAVLRALEQVFAPLARLAVARGLRFAAAEELFKRAFVHAARAAHAGSAGHRDVSRISTATGLNRREVARLSAEVPTAAALRRSPATETFTRWMSSRKLRDRSGRPLPLPRQGKAPSFEALAHSVTQDVHPRSLLEELCRLGLARLDTETDTVHLLADTFVPRHDETRMFDFLARNVSDHLSAAVGNVLDDPRRHFEQAVFADGLSTESLAVADELVRAQWRVLMTAMVPQLEALIEGDRVARRQADQRLRIGLYAYSEGIPGAAPEDSEEP